MTINATFADSNARFNAKLIDANGFDVSFENAYVLPVEKYTGNYEVTPADYAQILPTENKLMTQDLTVKPIPSNYGLVTWNGSYLTIS